VSPIARSTRQTANSTVMTRAATSSTQDGSMGDEMYPSKPGHGTLSHPWPGSPLHQRAETLVPGPMLPKTERTVRQLPASVVTWPLGWKLQCWMYASLQSSRCETEPSTGIVRHLPGVATFSSCRPFRFQRWKSEPLQGLITTGCPRSDWGRPDKSRLIGSLSGPGHRRSPHQRLAPRHRILC
jgi:hypothetical protein